MVSGLRQQSASARRRLFAHAIVPSDPLPTFISIPRFHPQVVQGTINFAVGTPGPELIPKQALDAALTAAVARNTDPLMYQYARIRGTDPFGTAVAAFLQSNGLRDVKASHVCASFGNSLALATIAKIFACPGDCAVVEDPTYFLAGKIFADAGIRCVRVGVDCDGLQVASDTLNLFPSSTVGT